MRKMFVGLVSTVGLLLALACQARLGETREQCEKRYGKPIEKMTDDEGPYWSAVFQVGPYQVKVRIGQDGKANSVAYLKESYGFDDIEVRRFLAVNAEGCTWVAHPLGNAWIRSDGFASALDTEQKEFVIERTHIYGNSAEIAHSNALLRL